MSQKVISPNHQNLEYESLFTKEEMEALRVEWLPKGIHLGNAAGMHLAYLLPVLRWP